MGKTEYAGCKWLNFIAKQGISPSRQSSKIGTVFEADLKGKTKYAGWKWLNLGLSLSDTNMICAGEQFMQEVTAWGRLQAAEADLRR